MRIEHIALYVNDLESARRFFVKHFGATSNGPRTTGDGYYESCIIALEDNQIEITI